MEIRPMKRKTPIQILGLVRRELALRNYQHAGELLEMVAESACGDPEFFRLLALLNEAEGRVSAARQFHRHEAVGKPHSPTAFDSPARIPGQETLSTEGSSTRNHL
jgi:hypothetical protein